VYRETKTWPQDERFGLIAQVRRAAFSIPANIAEGASRRGRKDFARYLNIALGSHGELELALCFARDLGYLSDQVYQEMTALQDSAGRLLWRLYAAMRKGDSDGA
jgi:four helix bundle protein